MKQKTINMADGGSSRKKERYERPSTEMYEMEIESAVLSGSGVNSEGVSLGGETTVDEGNADENGNGVW